MVGSVVQRGWGVRSNQAALAFALLGLWACTGTEHIVFSPIDELPPVVAPGMAGAGPSPSTDAGSIPDPPDAASDGDPANVPDPELDPGITFDWAETLPGQGTCKSGSYAGSFTCSMPPPEPGAIGPPPPLAGQVVFTLGDLSEEQELAVVEGSIKDAVAFGLVFSSAMRGSLACRDERFTAQSVDGMIAFGTFEATLDGAFDDQALAIDGDFVMVDQAGQRCEGTFHVSASP